MSTIHECHIDEERKSHHPEHVRKNLTTRLNRIEGQIRGIKGMVEIMDIAMIFLRNYLRHNLR